MLLWAQAGVAVYTSVKDLVTLIEIGKQLKAGIDMGPCTSFFGAVLGNTSLW